MDILLHLGAHRCATTTFQSFLRANRIALAKQGLTCWTPRRTRDGLMRGLLKHPALITLEDERHSLRSVGRIRLEAERLSQEGQTALLISEENIIGTTRNNLADMRLYPLLQERLRRFAPAFDGARMTIGLSVRSYEGYWASVLACHIVRGGAKPSADMLDWLTTQPRRWRSVVRDIAVIFPKAELVVWPFERMAGRPQDQLQLLWSEVLPRPKELDIWRNRGADMAKLNNLLALRGEKLNGQATAEAGTRWMPFDQDQASVLRAEYRRDIAWLKAGAEGLARYAEGRPAPLHGKTERTGPVHQLNNGRTVPATGPDRAIMNTLSGGRPDGIEERLGRTGAS